MESLIVVFVNHTDKALLVYVDDPDCAEWVPKSQIEYDENEVECARAGDDIEINIPAWLAEQKGFL